MRSPLVPAAALLTAFSLTACDRAPAQSRTADAPVPVRVAPVVFTPRQSVLALSGSVHARTVADLAFRVGGKVVDRPVEVGDHVRAGQVLAHLDHADLELSFEAAQSTLQSAIADAAKARADFSRYQRLSSNSPAFLPSEYDARLSATRMADARLLQVERQVTLAKDQLDYSTLTADAEGVITALPVQVGQVVAAGQTVASLAHTAQTEVVVDVPENRLPEVRSAARIDISLWADPEHKLTGHVREIGAQADAASRTFAVKVTVLDPQNLLALGMTATVRFLAPPRAPVAILPATAITDRNGVPAVWVFDPKAQHAMLQRVKIAGYGGDGSVSIASGVSSGEQVVTAGASEIDPNMRLVAWAGAAR
jgi:multidrug efflux system membrane fusion protein